MFQAYSLKDQLKELESHSHQLQKNVSYYKTQFNQSVNQVKKTIALAIVPLVESVIWTLSTGFPWASVASVKILSAW